MQGRDLSDPNWVDFLLITIFVLMIFVQLYKMGLIDQVQRKLNPPVEQEVNVEK